MSSLSTRIAELGLEPGHRLVQGADDEVLFGMVGALTEERPDATSRVELNRDWIVALSLASPVDFVRALLRLDGTVRGLLLLAPNLSAEAVSALMTQASAQCLFSDRSDLPDAVRLSNLANPSSTDANGHEPVATQWLMTTSGTTGTPKIVQHSLASLTRSVRRPQNRQVSSKPTRWGLLYDPSRFAGLQVVLQSLLTGGTLVVPDPEPALTERLAFLAAHGCTHLSATPTLWRKLLMAIGETPLALTQVTLGGEIADGRILAALAKRFPEAQITHIYASTEVGVGFSVKDGQPGFPVAFLEAAPMGVSIKVVDGDLWLRADLSGSSRGFQDHIERDAEGYIRTSDRVEIRDDRVLFLGRESSSVNIGGVKVQIEDVERIIAEHPGVSQCAVTAKPNPIMGSLLMLAVVPALQDVDPHAFRDEIKAWCKDRLPREAQPANIRVVADIALNSAGKIQRGQTA